MLKKKTKQYIKLGSSYIQWVKRFLAKPLNADYENGDMMRRHLKENSSFSLFFQAIFRVYILVAAVLFSFLGLPVLCKVICCNLKPCQLLYRAENTTLIVALLLNH